MIVVAGVRFVCRKEEREEDPISLYVTRPLGNYLSPLYHVVGDVYELRFHKALHTQSTIVSM